MVPGGSSTGRAPADTQLAPGCGRALRIPGKRPRTEQSPAGRACWRGGKAREAAMGFPSGGRCAGAEGALLQSEPVE